MIQLSSYVVIMQIDFVRVDGILLEKLLILACL